MLKSKMLRSYKDSPIDGDNTHEIFSSAKSSKSVREQLDEVFDNLMKEHILPSISQRRQRHVDFNRPFDYDKALTEANKFFEDMKKSFYSNIPAMKGKIASLVENYCMYGSIESMTVTLSTSHKLTKSGIPFYDISCQKVVDFYGDLIQVLFPIASACIDLTLNGSTMTIEVSPCYIKGIIPDTRIESIKQWNRRFQELE